MTFNKWLDTLVSEKQIDRERRVEVEGPSGTNSIPLAIVIDAIKTTSGDERAAIKNTLVKIDFCNGDIVHYFKHLAQAIAL